MPDPRSREVYAALRAYCERALEVVAANYEEQDDRYRVVEHWKEGPENVFRRVVLEEPDPWLPIRRNRDALEGLSEYGVAEEALRRDEVFGPQMDTIVGTTMAVHRVEPDDIVQGLLGKVLSPGFDLDETLFDEVYAELEDVFARRSVPVVVVMPLRGLLLEESPFELEPDLELDLLNDDELSACLAFGLLRGPLDMSGDMVILDANSRSGLRYRIFLEKVVGEDRLGSGDTRETIDATLERAILALRLLKSGDIAPSNRVILLDDWFMRQRSMMPGTFPSRDWPGEYSLRRADHGGLRQVLGALQNEAVRNQRSLQLALRRFSMAADRTLAEDKILDTTTAAEALFLNDLGKERAELGYRSSLRAAFLLGEEMTHRRRIQRFMRDAYNVRSRISHGDEVSTAKAFDETEVDLRVFADGLHEVMRSAINEVVRRVTATGSMIDWNGLILGSRGHMAP